MKLLILLLLLSSACYAQKDKRTNLEAAKFSLIFHKRHKPMPDTIRATITAVHKLKGTRVTFEGYIIGRNVFDTCWGKMPGYMKVTDVKNIQ